jgi:type IV secretion system protein VirD4
MNSHGSARFATAEELKPLHRSGGVFVGFDEKGQALRVDSDAPMMTIGGARTGKGAACLMRAIIDTHESMVIHCPKGENAAVTLNSHHKKGIKAYYLNPFNALNGLLPQHTLNPFDCLVTASPTLAEDAFFFASNIVTNGQHSFFQEQAQEVTYAILRTEVFYKGFVTVEDVAARLECLKSDPPRWEEYAEAMACVPCSITRAIGKRLAYNRKHAQGEFSGTVGTLSNAFSFLLSPSIMRMFGGNSPDFSFSQVCQGANPTKVFITLKSEYLGQYGAVLRLLYSSLMLHKAKAPPNARRVTMLMDEAAQLGKFPALVQTITLKSGEGLKCWHIWQDMGQIEALYGKEILKTFFESSQVLQVLRPRHHETAQYFSNALGKTTKEYISEHHHTNREDLKFNLMDAYKSGHDLATISRAKNRMQNTTTERAKREGLLMSSNEINSMPPDEMLLWVNELVRYPIIAKKINYYDDPKLSGDYLPNPWHSSPDKIDLPDYRFKRAIITTAPPFKFRDFPQFQKGYKFVKGYK